MTNIIKEHFGELIDSPQELKTEEINKVIEKIKKVNKEKGLQYATEITYKQKPITTIFTSKVNEIALMSPNLIINGGDTRIFNLELFNEFEIVVEDIEKAGENLEPVPFHVLNIKLKKDDFCLTIRFSKKED